MSMFNQLHQYYFFEYLKFNTLGDKLSIIN